jgi:hypothetical protein
MLGLGDQSGRRCRYTTRNGEKSLPSYFLKVEHTNFVCRDLGFFRCFAPCAVLLPADVLLRSWVGVRPQLQPRQLLRDLLQWLANAQTSVQYSLTEPRNGL